MASTVFDVATLVHALGLIEARLSPASWEPRNPDQERLLALRAEFAEPVAQLRHLEGLASPQATELNDFLAARGFAFRFVPFKSPTEFGVVATIAEATRWPEVGEPTPVSGTDGKTYHGFALRDRGLFWTLDGGRRLVAMPSGDEDQSQMWLILGDDLPDGRDAFALFDAAHQALAAKAAGYGSAYAGVTMPTEVLERTTELDWLVGLAAPDGDPRITKAVQEARLRVDRLGSEAKVASALGVFSSSMMPMARPPRIIVDAPHLVFWTDSAVEGLPLAVARFEQDAWGPYDATRAAIERAD